jgi:hypothetical protein
MLTAIEGLGRDVRGSREGAKIVRCEAGIGRIGRMGVGSGKWEVGSGKWEVRSLNCVLGEGLVGRAGRALSVRPESCNSDSSPESAALWFGGRSVGMDNCVETGYGVVEKTYGDAD